jgi:hypothetical protein
MNTIKDRRLKDMICPQCMKQFILSWNYGYMIGHPTLKFRECPSGGIYDVYIKCPHCDYQEDM